MTNKKQSGDTAVLFDDNIVSVIADQYVEQLRLEKIYQQDKQDKIAELERMIIGSLNTNIYKKLYKQEYGTYRQYVEEVARELRRRYDYTNNAKQ